ADLSCRTSRRMDRASVGAPAGGDSVRRSAPGGRASRLPPASARTATRVARGRPYPGALSRRRRRARAAGVTAGVLDAILARRADGLFARLGRVLPAAGRALDIGAGTGHNAGVVARETALDVTETDVACLRRSPGGLVLFDGGTLPFRDGMFACSL